MTRVMMNKSNTGRLCASNSAKEEQKHGETPKSSKLESFGPALQRFIDRYNASNTRTHTIYLDKDDIEADTTTLLELVDNNTPVNSAFKERLHG